MWSWAHRLAAGISPNRAAILMRPTPIQEETNENRDGSDFNLCHVFDCRLRSPSSLGGKSPAMEACSKQWDDMKAAGKTEGKTWPSFWSDCSKNLAAKNGTEAAAPEKPAKAEKATPKKAVTSVRNEEDNASSAQQKKDCDARWDANKAKTGAHGWHDYFQFMSRCI